MSELTEERAQELRAAIARAAGAHAADPSTRGDLSTAMRSGYFAGLGRQEVIDLSGLPQHDAERVLDG